MNFNENKYYISASDMIEYNYCKRFIYFMNVLDIKAYEEKRYNVQMGRKIHERKAKEIDYHRKRIGVVAIKKNLYLSSTTLGICGIIDEVLFLENGQISILDYKYAKKISKFKTYFYQGVFYSLLVSQYYKKEIDVFYIVYTRDNNLLEKYEIRDTDRNKIVAFIQEIKYITRYGVFPPRAKSTTKCIDCTYRNICF